MDLSHGKVGPFGTVPVVVCVRLQLTKVRRQHEGYCSWLVRFVFFSFYDGCNAPSPARGNVVGLRYLFKTNVYYLKERDDKK